MGSISSEGGSIGPGHGNEAASGAPAMGDGAHQMPDGVEEDGDARENVVVKVVVYSSPSLLLIALASRRIVSLLTRALVVPPQLPSDCARSVG